MKNVSFKRIIHYMTYDEETQDCFIFIFNLTNKYSNIIQVNVLLIDINFLILNYLKLALSDRFG